MNNPLPSLNDLKIQAKRLRATLESNGNKISHSASLEMMAKQYGYKDWNTLHAAVGNEPPTCPVTLGQKVRGHYLGQAFLGDVIGVHCMNHPGKYRVTLRFEEPVDVVTFDSFSSYRQRVSCTIDQNGKTMEKTSNGQPQMRIEL